MIAVEACIIYGWEEPRYGEILSSKWIVRNGLDSSSYTLYYTKYVDEEGIADDVYYGLRCEHDRLDHLPLSEDIIIQDHMNKEIVKNAHAKIVAYLTELNKQIKEESLKYKIPRLGYHAVIKPASDVNLEFDDFVTEYDPDDPVIYTP